MDYKSSLTLRKQNKIYILLITTYLRAIIVGSEENGISKEFLKMSDFQTKIPILGNINSLNVSVSGIILYVAIRQRKLIS